ncbi:hypothetical protein [Streptomyces sp. NBC_00576]|uniref:hypothetical protein n=1 Tax=Streptomyces sp. NBC_00576 TaxID=2903665 RepID=UPI002E803227|nr:hypothetical protein [Streptomyces sp. NBC_00576]
MMDRASLTDALDAAKAHVGGIDLLEYSPAPHSPVPGLTMAAASEVTVDNLQPQIEYTLHGAVTAAQADCPPCARRAPGRCCSPPAAAPFTPCRCSATSTPPLRPCVTG